VVEYGGGNTQLEEDLEIPVFREDVEVLCEDAAGDGEDYTNYVRWITAF
jgi:hypothetical protein